MKFLVISNTSYINLGGTEKYNFQLIKLIRERFPDAQIDEYVMDTNIFK
jgi:hypothetical protein